MITKRVFGIVLLFIFFIAKIAYCDTVHYAKALVCVEVPTIYENGIKKTYFSTATLVRANLNGDDRIVLLATSHPFGDAVTHPSSSKINVIYPGHGELFSLLPEELSQIRFTSKDDGTVCFLDIILSDITEHSKSIAGLSNACVPLENFNDNAHYIQLVVNTGGRLINSN